MATSIRPIWQMDSLLFVAQVTLQFSIPKVLSRIFSEFCFLFAFSFFLITQMVALKSIWKLH